MPFLTRLICPPLTSQANHSKFYKFAWFLPREVGNFPSMFKTYLRKDFKSEVKKLFSVKGHVEKIFSLHDMQSIYCNYSDLVTLKTARDNM